MLIQDLLLKLGKNIRFSYQEMLLKNPARERERKTIRGQKSKKERTADFRNND